jgi:hypothetical protein
MPVNLDRVEFSRVPMKPIRNSLEPVRQQIIPYLGPETYERWRDSDLGSITEKLEQELILKLLGDVTRARVPLHSR